MKPSEIVQSLARVLEEEKKRVQFDVQEKKERMEREEQERRMAAAEKAADSSGKEATEAKERDLKGNAFTASEGAHMYCTYDKYTLDCISQSDM